MGWEGAGIFSEVEGRMNAKQYVESLKSGLDSNIEKLGIKKEEIIFQPDNDSKNTSNLATNWFDTEDI